jgi:hypothetical protein
MKYPYFPELNVFLNQLKHITGKSGQVANPVEQVADSTIRGVRRYGFPAPIANGGPLPAGNAFA